MEFLKDLLVGTVIICFLIGGPLLLVHLVFILAAIGSSILSLLVLFLIVFSLYKVRQCE
jgi:hypothetical protein